MVRKTDDVAELMHKRSDTVGTHLVIINDRLVGAGIMVQSHTVEGEDIIAQVGDVGRMGPHARHRTVGSLTEVGVEDEDVVDKSVTIQVIIIEVNLVVELLTGLYGHLFGMQILAPGVVGTIVIPFLIQKHRTVDIKSRTKLTHRILDEEVARRSCGSVSRESLLIEHAVEIVMRVLDVKLHILILHEHYQCASLTGSGKGGIAESGIESLLGYGHDTAPLLRGAAQGIRGYSGRGVTLNEHPVGILSQDSPFGVDKRMIKLIARTNHHNDRTVRLSIGTKSRSCWHGRGYECGHRSDQKS